MCGIVGAICGQKINAASAILDGLRHLEYRGYDSAGLALRDGGGGLRRIRVAGRVAELKRASRGVCGHLGVGHTRWATHGAPAEKNAHPLMSRDSVAVVHNGIIENHELLRRELQSQGCEFESETDSEVLAHLLEIYMREDGDLFAAMQKAIARLEGAYAVAALSGGGEESLVCARFGSPLLAGIGEGGGYLASDAQALINRANQIAYLEDGDCAKITRDKIEIRDSQGAAVNRPFHRLEESAAAVNLDGYRHFMQKEIFEQPEAIAATIKHCIEREEIPINVFGRNARRILSRAKSVMILACGTSYHAGLTARNWIESLAKIPCIVEVASERRYRDGVGEGILGVAISQSGETADTLAAFRDCAKSGRGGGVFSGRLAICNQAMSSMARESELLFLTHAGPEIGVASTKTFTSAMAALFLFAAALAKAKGLLSVESEREAVKSLRHLPFAVRRALLLEKGVRSWAREIAEANHALFLGRGSHYPLALEGALKLKEISYIHAEGYPAGELKHGPLALVDGEMPVIALAPDSSLLEKTASNLSEVAARGGRLYVLCGKRFEMRGAKILRINDEGAEMLSPIIYSAPLQLLAYHTARVKGTDIDKPRNLAKSVTVE